MADELDDQPSGTVQTAGSGKSMRLGLRTFHGCSWRLYQKTDERLYRRGDYGRMAVSHRRADR